VNVHGTLSKAACEGCGTSMDINEFCSLVEMNIKDIYDQTSATSGPKESKSILCNTCHKPLVKPTTVLFGRNLPAEFFESSEQDLPTLDLLIITGTSLVVSPANSLVYRCPTRTKRVIINKEPVGMDLGIQYDSSSDRDYFMQGNCDEIFLDLIVELGWFDSLYDMIDLLPPFSANLVRNKKKKL
jgi:NAD-dependent deacetylase sirtuin 2